MHEGHELPQQTRIGLAWRRMPEIEDVAGSSTGLIEDCAGASFDCRPSGHEPSRLEIALNGAIGTQPLPGLCERLPGIDPDDVSTGRGHLIQDARGSNSEVNGRDRGR